MPRLVFLADIFTDPSLGTTGSRDAYNRHLEKTYQPVIFARVFSLGWVYGYPRDGGRSRAGRLAGLVRVQAGDSGSGFSKLRQQFESRLCRAAANRVSDPNEFAGRSVAKFFNTGSLYQRTRSL